MNLNKPDFWDLKKKNLYAILLLPLTAIYFLALSLKKKIIRNIATSFNPDIFFSVIIKKKNY
jgi:hypothetical protein